MRREGVVRGWPGVRLDCGTPMAKRAAVDRRSRRGEDAHTRAIEGASVCIISASVYRSGARANQTDIIDLTCDLEIRKITDGERLEPIIIVNIGRPVSRFLAAVAVLTLPSP